MSSDRSWFFYSHYGELTDNLLYIMHIRTLIFYIYSVNSIELGLIAKNG